MHEKEEGSELQRRSNETKNDNEERSSSEEVEVERNESELGKRDGKPRESWQLVQCGFTYAREGRGERMGMGKGKGE